MNGPLLVDTAYEWAGFQAAASLHAALSDTGLPVIFALSGLAWRVFRASEDGLLRPLLVHVLALAVLAALLSPASADRADAAHRRAPRALAWLDAAADGLMVRAVAGVDADFLKNPYEWERLALLAGVARFEDPALRERMATFFEGCTLPALARVKDAAPAAALRNPLADGTGLEYAALYDGTGRTCEDARRALLGEARREVEDRPAHRDRLGALLAYEGGSRELLASAYLDKLVRNEWRRPAPSAGELALARSAAGPMTFLDPDRQTAQSPSWWRGSALNLVPGSEAGHAFVSSAAFAAIGASKQWFADGISARERQYLVSAHAPQLYGLFVMLLLALFPVAGLLALLPGKWTVLLQFAKVFASVKLWPLGWALLTAFAERRPAHLALADVAGGTGGEFLEAFRQSDPPNVFVSVSLMYFVVPAVSFLVVNLVSGAAAAPFAGAAPRAAAAAVPAPPRVS